MSPEFARNIFVADALRKSVRKCLLPALLCQSFRYDNEELRYILSLNESSEEVLLKYFELFPHAPLMRSDIL